ncbi:hypothetical protein PQX77_016229 [Marasmius sp. AFHP31]|nr:hypothetical protein PQX77_016229 [Marasmius sp. AFHP31]
MSTRFSNAQGWTIGAHANFQTIAGNSTTTNIHNTNSITINIYHNSNSEVTLHGRTARRAINDHIVYRRVLSSEVLSVNVNLEGASTSMKFKVVKVKKMEQTAKIYGYRGKFTVTGFEPVDEKDREGFEQVWFSIWFNKKTLMAGF